MDGTSIESMTDSRRLPLPATSPIAGNVLRKVKNITWSRGATTGCNFLPKHNAKTPCKTTLKMKTWWLIHDRVTSFKIEGKIWTKICSLLTIHNGRILSTPQCHLPRPPRSSAKGRARSQKIFKRMEQRRRSFFSPAPLKPIQQYFRRTAQEPI